MKMCASSLRTVLIGCERSACTYPQGFMYCEVNFISEAYVCEGSEYLRELRSIKGHMVISDVIVSRAYNDIESIHIML